MKSSQDAWINFADQTKDEPTPEGWEDTNDPAVKSLRVACLMKALRPDNLPAALSDLTEKVMGAKFLYLAPFELAQQLELESDPKTPFLFVAVPGFDPSGTVGEVALAMAKKLESLAMGNSDGYEIADTMIA